MLGDVYVTVVLMESNDQVSAFNDNSETWTASAIAAVKSKIQEGLQWWESALARITDKHALDFVIDFQHADQPVPTRYEPIINVSSKFNDWIYDFLDLVGHNREGSYSSDIRSFNNSQRLMHGTDWAFTIFVVNDEHDSDGSFAPPSGPGDFDKAFAFSGGRFFVMPAGRPASTVSHETGHMFWALDEYYNAGRFAYSRGYYSTQNSNSWDNPAFSNPGSGQSQQPSIMASGDLLQQAYVANTSSRASLEMIGWRDSDGDGVFDVLDVPLTLSGSGYFDESESVYRFRGTSSVQTLPNRNPYGPNSSTTGLQNDITLNEVSRAEYRLDGGEWQAAAVLGGPVVSLDVSVACPIDADRIEIRTVDATTGVTSPVFVGTRQRATIAGDSGVFGFVFGDEDHDGVWDSAERGLPGVSVQLVDANGALLALRRDVEPDSFPTGGTLLTGVTPGVILSAVGTGVANSSVIAMVRPGGTAGDHVFGSSSQDLNCQGACASWTSSTRQMRLDFGQPVAVISLDAVADSDGDVGRLEVYDRDGRLIGRYTTQSLAPGSREAMVVTRASADIAYAISHAHAGSTVMFDSLQFGPAPSSVTDSFGAFNLPYLSEGQYRVQVQPDPRQFVTTSGGGYQAVAVTRDLPPTYVDFGMAETRTVWQNPGNKLDVNDDSWVTPVDALQIINMLNQSGARKLASADKPPPYVDTSGDGQISPVDVLLVINALNQGVRVSYIAPAHGGGSTGGGNAEGESFGSHGSFWWKGRADSPPSEPIPDGGVPLIGNSRDQSKLRVIPSHCASELVDFSLTDGLVDEALAEASARSIGRLWGNRSQV